MRRVMWPIRQCNYGCTSQGENRGKSNTREKMFLKKKKRAKIFPASEGKFVSCCGWGVQWEILLLLLAASLLFPVQHPLGRDLAIGGPGPSLQVTFRFFHFYLFTCGWLVTLVLLLASRFVIFSVRVHVVRSAISAKRNNEKVPDAERRRILWK